MEPELQKAIAQIKPNERDRVCFEPSVANSKKRGQTIAIWSDSGAFVTKSNVSSDVLKLAALLTLTDIFSETY